MENTFKRPRKVEAAAKRTERLERGAQSRKAAKEVDDANVQRMIERSIKDHGA